MAADYGCVLRLPELVLEHVADTFDLDTVPSQTMAVVEGVQVAPRRRPSGEHLSDCLARTSILHNFMMFNK
jgi:hypothetical protein